MLKVYLYVLFTCRFSESTGEDGWRRIGLAYKVEWPFNSLITPKVLKKYNEIFGYLLLIRRVQMQLHKCLGLEIRLKKLAKPCLRPRVSSARFHMSFLIDNIQFYLQVMIMHLIFLFFKLHNGCGLKNENFLKALKRYLYNFLKEEA